MLRTAEFAILKYRFANFHCTSVDEVTENKGPYTDDSNIQLNYSHFLLEAHAQLHSQSKCTCLLDQQIMANFKLNSKLLTKLYIYYDGSS